jgi:hypothetical protein
MQGIHAKQVVASPTSSDALHSDVRQRRHRAERGCVEMHRHSRQYASKESATFDLRQDDRRPLGIQTLGQCVSSIAALGRGAYAAMLPRINQLSETSHQLQTKYRALREQFTIQRKRYYLIECAWCKRRIGWKRKREEDAVPGDTSHGICPPCAADVRRDIAKLRFTPPHSIR